MIHAQPRTLGLALLASTTWACGGPAASPAPAPATMEPATSAPRIFQPGAPGEGTRTLNAADVARMTDLPYTDADVRFMQGMIHHHAQALQMTELVAERTRDESLRRLSLRIDISQKDEIALMERWLRNRGEQVPEWRAHMGHAAGAMGGMPMMPGMLSPEQMSQLRAAQGVAFERLFLELMIQHHDGALIMVRDLFASEGAGQDTDIFRFASDVDADQSMEIQRMRGMLEARR